MIVCEAPKCRNEFRRPGHRGPLPRFCSTRCRVAAHRAEKARRAQRQMPVEMTSRRQWVRARGKRPVTLTDRPASTTRPYGWVTYAEAAASRVGTGLGVMLGYGPVGDECELALACLDLDGCIGGDGVVAGWAREAASSVEALWVERSMSGRGLHVFHLVGAAGRGSRRGGLESYSRERFVVVTGDWFDLGVV